MTTEDLAVIAALLLAILLASVGAALIYLPAGLLVAGALLLASVAVYLRGVAGSAPDTEEDAA